MRKISRGARALRHAVAVGIAIAAPSCGGETRNEEPVPVGIIVIDAGSHNDSKADAGTGITAQVDGGVGIGAPDAMADAGKGEVSPTEVDATPDVSFGRESSAIIAVPLSGCTPSEYSATLTVGGSQSFQFSVDTGSTSMGVASNQCTSCGVSPLYQPGPRAVDQHMMATAEYGMGEWSGEIYQDVVGIPAKDFASVNLVAIDSQSQFFEPIQCGTGAPEGIVGLGPSASELSDTTPFFDQLVATTGMANVFATELCGGSGTLWLGGFDATFAAAPPQYVPFANSIFSEYYYAVNLSSITVEGVTTTVPSGQFTDSVVDTGTSDFILGNDAFNGISAAIAGSAGFQQVFGAADAGLSFLSSDQNCVSLGLTKEQLDATLPPLTLTFGATNVQAAATESYLINYDGQWCASIVGVEQDEESFPFASIMGSAVLRSNVVIFDRGNQQVGFAPHTACPG